MSVKYRAQKSSIFGKLLYFTYWLCHTFMAIICGPEIIMSGQEINMITLNLHSSVQSSIKLTVVLFIIYFTTVADLQQISGVWQSSVVTEQCYGPGLATC